MTIINVAKVLVLNDQNEVLILTRSSTDSHRPGKLDLPGGGIEIDEDPFTAVQRELREETGIQVPKDEFKLLFMGTVFEESLQQSVNRILFTCHTTNPTVILSHEHADYQWVAVQKLDEVYTHHFYTPALEYARKYSLLTV